jgi:hypothetical protein
LPASEPKLGSEGILFIHPDVKVGAFQIAVKSLPQDLKRALLLLVQMDPEQTAPILAQEGNGPEEEAQELFPVPHVLLLRLRLQPSQGLFPRPLTRDAAAEDLLDQHMGLLQRRPGPVEDPVHPPADKGENVVVSVPHLQLFRGGG